MNRWKISYLKFLLRDERNKVFNIITNAHYVMSDMHSCVSFVGTAMSKCRSSDLMQSNHKGSYLIPQNLVNKTGLCGKFLQPVDVLKQVINKIITYSSRSFEFCRNIQYSILFNALRVLSEILLCVIYDSLRFNLTFMLYHSTSTNLLWFN